MCTYKQGNTNCQTIAKNNTIFSLKILQHISVTEHVCTIFDLEEKTLDLFQKMHNYIDKRYILVVTREIADEVGNTREIIGV